MKKTIFVQIMLLISSFVAEGQIINNNFETDQHNRLQRHDLKGLLKNKRNELNIKALRQSKIADSLQSQALLATQNADEALLSNNDAAFQNANILRDKIQLAADDASMLADAKKSVARQNSKKASDLSGYLFGSGTVASLENPAGSNANLSLGCAINYRTHSLVIAYNQKGAVTNDSANLTKIFMFPEISSRGFSAQYDKRLWGYDIDSLEKQFSANIFANFSAGMIKDTAKNVINTYDIKVGLRLSLNFDLKDSQDSTARKLKNITVSVLPNYSIMSVDPKDFTGYNLMYNRLPNSNTINPNKNLQASVNAFGTRVELEVGSLTIFFDYKYVENANSNSVFNNSYWTIGSSVNTRIFSF